VAAAEKNHDPQAFFLALHDFTLAFKDGHVGLSGGQYANTLFSEQAGAGYGFAIRELDDGHFVVTYVTKGGPADKAGIVAGAEVTAFDDKPIGDAVKSVHNLPEPFSTDFALRYQQERYLLRAPEGTQARVTYQNPGQSSATATLTSVAETDSFDSTSIYRDYDPNALPVEYHLLGQGVGYVKINTNSDDLNLIYRLFERALQVFKKNQVQGLIVDLRVNPGGSPLGLAGYLTDKTITLGQLQYFSEKTGKFENNDLPELYEPFEHQYRFAKMAVMVDQGCASACELEAYGFSKVPGMIVVGQYPSAGVEAEVGRGQYKLPEGLSLQVPTGRFVLPDGSIFLEGKGVVPTLRVPINRDTVLSDQDAVLKAAAQAVMP
jgi:C-terminal processing protease CtpA/Prc